MCIRWQCLCMGVSWGGGLRCAECYNNNRQKLYNASVAATAAFCTLIDLHNSQCVRMQFVHGIYHCFRVISESSIWIIRHQFFLYVIILPPCIYDCSESHSRPRSSVKTVAKTTHKQTLTPSPSSSSSRTSSYRRQHCRCPFARSIISRTCAVMIWRVVGRFQ